jgi:hypothetical protein
MVDQLLRHIQVPLRLVLADIEYGRRLVIAVRVIHNSGNMCLKRLGEIIAERKVEELRTTARGQ